MQARAQAQASPSPAHSVGLGRACNPFRPKPTKARPKPGLLSPAWPSSSLNIAKTFTMLHYSIVNTVHNPNCEHARKYGAHILLHTLSTGLAFIVRYRSVSNHGQTVGQSLAWSVHSHELINHDRDILVLSFLCSHFNITYTCLLQVTVYTAVIWPCPSILSDSFIKYITSFSMILAGFPYHSGLSHRDLVSRF